ncbi:hypothetical protein H6CHR_00678 [Variovorax sp. PBL-H6]|uniref:hypothetical protein n=1 Tax=Variovorax sp. PBL-H6 TaxID=434009 RepID=UPI00131971A3|nr:hypothetical protein [Variovorax sp. PBL-H6]VTU17056.1 hypothetical protein H6CHR_00678 [Variovorax sp. PBL-H6]
MTLNVSGNQIGSPTVSAIADLLLESKTLVRILCDPPVFQADLGDSAAMLELVQAVEHNKSLLELQFRWTRDLDEYRASVNASLYRNRYAPQRAFMEAALEAAAAFVMPLFAGDLQYPQDMIQHIIRQGLTEHDALTLSSLNHETRTAHEESLRKIGS